VPDLEATIAKMREDEIARKPSEGVGPYLALGGGTAADILSTLYGQKHGAVESNPIYGGWFSGKDAAMKAAMSVPMALLMRYEAAHGHPTLAKWLGYGTGAGLGGVAAHNLSVTR